MSIVYFGLFVSYSRINQFYLQNLNKILIKINRCIARLIKILNIIKKINNVFGEGLVEKRLNNNNNNNKTNLVIVVVESLNKILIIHNFFNKVSGGVITW